MTTMSDNNLAIRTLDDVERLAQLATKSGLIAHKRPEAAAVVLLTGRELGLAPMAALRGIYEVSGRPVLSADMMVAVVRRSGLCASWRVTESTPERCTITTLRQGEQHPETCSWTMEDARRAGCGGQTWSKFPRQMLAHRCAAELARRVYPDVLLGLYTPDELGSDDAPASEREVVVAEVAQAPAPDDGPEVDGVSYVAAIEAIDLPQKAVAVWQGFKGAIGQLHPAARVAAWEAICERVSQVGRMGGHKAASAWLKKAIAEEEARLALAPAPAPEAQG